jgi:hypothetical protein
VVVKLYYEEIFNPMKRSITKLQKCVEKVMEQVWKDHHSTFYKHFPVCDPTFGPYFLKEIQVQYAINSKPKMLMEKLQMLAYSCVTP